MEEAQIKRIMPHSTEAEQAVIGSMLIDKDAVLTVSEIITKDDFYNRQFGVLYEAMLSLNAEGKAIDPIILFEKLTEMDVPKDLYSLQFIDNIMRSTPVSGYAKHYAQIVADCALKRRLIKVTSGIENDCYGGGKSTDELLDETEKKVFEIVSKRGNTEFESVRDIVIRSIDQIEQSSKKRGTVTGISTGFSGLDYKTAGLQNSDLILLAARPAMGKTAFALNIAEHAILKSRVPTALFSLEMSKTQLMTRLLSMNSRVSAGKLRTGDLQDDEWRDLMESARLFADSPLIIDDTGGISISELKSKCRKYKLEHNLGLIIIDYLQLMTGGTGHSSESRQQEISEISRSLKSLARELNVPILALSQLSRAVESRPDKRPMLSDLRESGAIEQDADIVMFIYREEYYKPDTEKKGIAEIIIGKQRNGPTGTVELCAQLECTRFTNLEVGDRQ